MSVKLEPGKEVDALLPGRKTYKRVKVLAIRMSGELIVADPRNGGQRVITPDRVRTVHYKQKLRKQ